jgi:hypothetical protein
MEERPAAVLLGAAGAATVRFDLSRPNARVRHAVPVKERGPLDGYEITSVQAPTDDRRLVIHLTKPGKFRGSPVREAELVISVVPHARGAALLGRDGHRFGAIGSPVPPRGEPRPLLAPEALQAAAESGNGSALMSGRWIGPAVVAWLLSTPEEIVDRYARIAALPPAQPARCDGVPLPFPFCEAPEPADSLIEPRDAPRSAIATRAGVPTDPRARAIARMREQLAKASEASVLRAAADALMALADGAGVPPSLTLPDGTAVALPVRAGDTAPAIAERLYEKARSMDRARTTLPERIARLEAEAQRAVPLREAGGSSSAVEPRRSYKRFTSRGGLEIRVGRSAKDNDALTFHDSSPDDVWLHARGASGSHVVLRWTRNDTPPGPDLEDAALLAAWHSRARGSTLVPVDWTRRRYVRKPRGAAPGSVVVSRAETVFVRPSAAAVRTIRDRG